MVSESMSVEVPNQCLFYSCGTLGHVCEGWSEEIKSKVLLIYY